jgi:hypothetical protein
MIGEPEAGVGGGESKSLLSRKRFKAAVKKLILLRAFRSTGVFGLSFDEFVWLLHRVKDEKAEFNWMLEKQGVTFKGTHKRPARLHAA